MLLTHGDSIDTVAENFRAIAYSGSIVAGVSLPAGSLHSLFFPALVNPTQPNPELRTWP